MEVKNTQFCVVCNKPFAEEHFYFNRVKKRYDAHCKECRIAEARKRRSSRHNITEVVVHYADGSTETMHLTFERPITRIEVK